MRQLIRDVFLLLVAGTVLFVGDHASVAIGELYSGLCPTTAPAFDLLKYDGNNPLQYCTGISDYLVELRLIALAAAVSLPVTFYVIFEKRWPR